MSLLAETKHGAIAASVLPRAPRSGSSSAWLAVLPLLLALSCMGFKFLNTYSITEDSTVFIRYAKALGGEVRYAPRDCWQDRNALTRASREVLHYWFPTLGAVETYDQHPGYPLLLLACHRLVGQWCSDDPAWQWVRAGQIGSMFFGCLLVIGVYFLGRRLLGRAAALAAGLFLGVCPVFASLQADVLSDVPALACLVLSTFHAVRLLDKHRRHDAFLAGAWGALGYLFRPEALLMALLLGAVLAWRLAFASRWLRHCASAGRDGPTRATDFAGYFTGPEERRSRALRLGIFLTIPIVFICGPYMFLKWSLLTKSTESLATASQGLLISLERIRGDSTSTHSLADGLGPFAWTYLRGVKRFLLGWAFNLHYLLFIPVLIGLARGWRPLLGSTRQRLIALAFLLNIILLPGVLFYVKGYLDHRHVLPVTVLTSFWCWPGLLALAALGRKCLVRLRLAGRETHPSFARLDRVLAGILLAILAALAARYTLSTPLQGGKVGHRHAGDWLRGRLAEKQTLLDPAGIASYFGGMQERNRWLPMEMPFPASRFHALIQDPSVAFVVVSDHMISAVRLTKLVAQDGKPPPPRLKEVQSFASSSATGARHRIRIFQVVDRKSVTHGALRDASSAVSP